MAIAILLIILGLSMILYPTVNNYMNTLKHRRVIAEFQSSVEALDSEDYDRGPRRRRRMKLLQTKVRRLLAIGS